MSTAGWTTSARFERRTKAEAASRTPHEGRTAAHPGDTHSNREIDASRTRFNKTWVGDGQGGVERTDDPMAWAHRVAANLDERARGPVVKGKVDDDGQPIRRAIRKDATAVVDAVFQLDPEWTGSSVDLLRPEQADRKAEVERLLLTMTRTHAEHVGWENVVGYSIQWDETHPHVHMQITPIAEDGSLNWKRFVNGPKALSVYHDKFRRDLQAQGYAATMERVDGGRDHEGLKVYKRNKDAARAAQEDREKAGVVLGGAQAEAELVRRRARREGREQAQADVERDLAPLRAQIAADAAQAEAHVRAAQAAITRAREAEERAYELLAEVEALTTPDDDRWTPFMAYQRGAFAAARECGAAPHRAKEVVERVRTAATRDDETVSKLLSPRQAAERRRKDADRVRRRLDALRRERVQRDARSRDDGLGR